MDLCDLLNIFIVLAELLVIETKLIHKVGSHLLDLVIGESLGEELTINTSAHGGFSGELIMLFACFLPAGETGHWGRGSLCRHPRWRSACCGC